MIFVGMRGYIVSDSLRKRRNYFYVIFLFFLTIAPHRTMLEHKRIGMHKQEKRIILNRELRENWQ